MKVFGMTIKPFWERDRNGNNWYYIDGIGDWGYSNRSNLWIAQNHPILTPALLFTSKLFSQARFFVEDIETGEKHYNHKELIQLENPNYYQTTNDFLEEVQFMMISTGQAIIYQKKIIGSSDVEANYVLNPDLINWGNGFKTKFPSRVDSNPIKNKTIKYDEKGLDLSIKIKDLLFLYDLPNGLDETNMFLNKSRLDGLKQTLINTKDSLVAKNIILKSNGKELVTGSQKEGGLQLTKEEKESAQSLFNLNYGLGVNKSRSLITKADINWKSLHIPLRDLGLDESVKVDGNLIYTALHIPKDILSLEAKKTTYNNYKESMVSYIQNEMQSSADAFCSVFNKKLLGTKFRLRATYDHLPVMAFINKEKYQGIEQRAKALDTLRRAGLPDEIALELCEFDKNTKLEPLKNEEITTQADTEGSESNGNEENQGEENDEGQE